MTRDEIRERLKQLDEERKTLAWRMTGAAGCFARQVLRDATAVAHHSQARHILDDYDAKIDANFEECLRLNALRDAAPREGVSV